MGDTRRLWHPLSTLKQGGQLVETSGVLRTFTTLTSMYSTYVSVQVGDIAPCNSYGAHTRQGWARKLQGRVTAHKSGDGGACRAASPRKQACGCPSDGLGSAECIISVALCLVSGRNEAAGCPGVPLREPADSSRACCCLLLKLKLTKMKSMDGGKSASSLSALVGPILGPRREKEATR